MVTRQEFIQGFIDPLMTGMKPLALADVPGAVVRGVASGQPFSEAFGEVMSDPLSTEGRVYGEDITGDPGTGALMDLLLDPMMLASLGTAGLGATLARGAGRKGPWAGMARKAIDPRLRESALGVGRHFKSPTQSDDSLAFLLERLVNEIEGGYPGRMPGVEPEYSSILGRTGRGWPESNIKKFRTVRGARDPGAAVHYGSNFAGQGPRRVSPFGRDITLREAREKALDIGDSWTLQEVKEVLAVAKAGGTPQREEALGRLRDLFGNGFGSDPGHSAIIPASGVGARNVGDIKEILSLRKEINTVLHNSGYIDEPMSIHQAVLQEDPGGHIYSGAGSRDIIEKLSPPTMFAHRIKTKQGEPDEVLRELMRRISRVQ